MLSVAVAALISCGSFAEGLSPTAQADLDERLRIETEGFIKDISTLGGENLIKTADLILGSGISNKELYTAVDDKVTKNYQEHMNNPKDDIIAQELNSLIRALASIGPQAKEVIMRLDESKSRGIRERAVRLLPKLEWFSRRNSLMQKTDYYEQGQDLMTYRYLNLITSDDPVMRRYGAEEINRRGGAEAIVYKKMAERLEKDKGPIFGSVDIDAYAWFCRILRDYDSQNSSQLLSAITNDKTVPKKIKKYTH
ncbi:MAG: hypothetical protein V4732_02180 [Pseudomonadota bacterium]